MKMTPMNWGYIIGLLVVIPLLIWVVNLLFFRGNSDAEKYVDSYISDSDIVEITIPGQVEDDFKVYYPKLSRGDGTKVYRRSVFYYGHYNKYLAIITFESFDYGPMQKRDGSTYTVDYNKLRSNLILDNRTISARINRKQLNDPSYGTKQNPVPIFLIDLVDNISPPETIKYFHVRESTNRIFVTQYLTHFLSKKEFKKLFNNGK